MPGTRLGNPQDLFRGYNPGEFLPLAPDMTIRHSSASENPLRQASRVVDQKRFTRFTYARVLSSEVCGAPQLPRSPSHTTRRLSVAWQNQMQVSELVPEVASLKGLGVGGFEMFRT